MGATTHASAGRDANRRIRSIMLIDGPDGPRATVGSGNLTFRGWGHNIETLDLLVPARAPLAFADLAHFLR